jgi:hypothetical protein
METIVSELTELRSPRLSRRLARVLMMLVVPVLALLLSPSSAAQAADHLGDGSADGTEATIDDRPRTVEH